MNVDLSLILVIIIFEHEWLAGFPGSLMFVNFKVNGAHFVVTVTPVVVLHHHFDIGHFWETAKLVSVKLEHLPFRVECVFDMVRLVDFISINVELEIRISGAALHAFVHNWKVPGVNLEGERHYARLCVLSAVTVKPTGPHVLCGETTA